MPKLFYRIPFTGGITLDTLETLTANSQIANEEMLVHFDLRDRVLLAFIAAVGTLLSIALTKSSTEILFAMPYLALGCAILVSQHNLLIGTLLDYLSKEVAPQIQQQLPKEEIIPYHTSKAYKRDAVKALKLRLYGHTIITIGPCILALAINYNYIFNPISTFGIIWFLAFLCTVGAAYLIIGIHIRRIKIKSRHE